MLCLCDEQVVPFEIERGQIFVKVLNLPFIVNVLTTFNGPRSSLHREQSVRVVMVRGKTT